MNKLNFVNLTMLSLLILSIVSCGTKDFKKTPLDNYIVENSKEKQFSVILEDMNVEGTFFKTYLHKYKVIKHKEDDTPYEEVSDWIEVEEGFFDTHVDNLGMVILEKKGQGEISKVASPPGYGYVGDSRYGEWRTHNGSTFWGFYGRYMFMNQMFGMISRPIYQSDYRTYRDGGYYGRKSYYGPRTAGGSSRYGTNSTQTRKDKPNFFRRRASKTGWSSSRSRSGSRSRSTGFGK
ncbi:hypothetical protein [Aquimarina algicola]|uniref:Uncharacterized protein n=1 Tax=Aquimarina algicola TaxID=2589995 RepID=A0A504JEW0_9FLAO|nr:hypothetical protein [Aquimarina algicola]TPN89214.1 hypothetical protein FHK87_03025 [Aquimarina algicola]